MLLTENTQLKDEINNLQNEFDFQRSQLTKEIEGLSEESDRLMRILDEKNIILSAQNEMITSLKGESRDQEPNTDFRSAQDRIEYGDGA